MIRFVGLWVRYQRGNQTLMASDFTWRGGVEVRIGCRLWPTRSSSHPHTNRRCGAGSQRPLAYLVMKGTRDGGIPLMAGGAIRFSSFRKAWSWGVVIRSVTALGSIRNSLIIDGGKV